MKLQISFDIPDLETALEVAKKAAPYADIIEVGTVLLYAYGMRVVQKFHETFPDKVILADTKIIDRGREIITMMGPAQNEWFTVMAGTSKTVIHSACTAAHQASKKVMIDLLDSASLGQSALEAKNLGADALLFHQPYDEQDSFIFLDKWEMIRDNTDLPIFVSAKIKRETIDEVLKIKPDAVVIGKSITEADDPEAEAAYFKELVSKS